ncbi:E3 ubiquitin-protein ligase RNF19A-like [Thunnus thynnus]|uniref:E3 ubiquitin-protein ligase RNF19A-like n=1 Tax=Thunnus thynnus TaxID=8237 RepID=UPI0035280DE8
MEKCYDPRDTSLKFVDRDDDLDFLCEGFKSRRAQMSCGHAVTPTSLTNWCRRLLDEGKSRFVCGCCRQEWSYVEVRKMALLTPEEMEYFEKTMAVNAIRDNFHAKLCPGCKSSVVRKDESNLSVRCTFCTANKQKPYEFCWQCLSEWKGPSPRSDRCENDGCCNSLLETLRTCPDIVFDRVVVSGCPSIRACPTCGALVQHDKTKCKNTVCLQCKKEFCFVCLKLTKECMMGNTAYYALCSSGVAPRQTSIPVWQQN